MYKLIVVRGTSKYFWGMVNHNDRYFSKWIHFGQTGEPRLFESVEMARTAKIEAMKDISFPSEASPIQIRKVSQFRIDLKNLINDIRV